MDPIIWLVWTTVGNLSGATRPNSDQRSRPMMKEAEVLHATPRLALSSCMIKPKPTVSPTISCNIYPHSFLSFDLNDSDWLILLGLQLLSTGNRLIWRLCSAVDAFVPLLLTYRCKKGVHHPGLGQRLTFSDFRALLIWPAESQTFPALRLATIAVWPDSSPFRPIMPR